MNHKNNLINKSIILSLVFFSIVLSINTASAVDKTYYWNPSSGAIDSSGFTANWGNCGAQPTSYKITTLSGTGFTCNSDKLTRSSSGDQFLAIFPTAYSSDTQITGKPGATFYLSSQRSAYTATYRFDLGYARSGTFTSLGYVTQSVETSSGMLYTIDLSSISGTAPSGSYLALKVSVTTSRGGRVYLGTNGGSTGSNSGRFYINEIAAAPPAPTYNVSISVSPVSADITEGNSYSYNITVSNTGNTNGNYTLSVTDSDTVNFNNSTLGTTTMQINSGGSAQTTLTVTAKVNATLGAIDNTIITVRSVEDSIYISSTQVQTTVINSTYGESNVNKTYYWIPSSGDIGSSGFTANWGNCGATPTSYRITTLSSTGFTCSADSLTTTYSGDQYLAIFPTAYSSDTQITGKTGATFYLSSQRSGYTATYRFDLGYAQNGTFTSLGYVTQSATSTGRSYTIDMSSISGTAPSGSYLALKVSVTTSRGGRVYLGTNGGSSGSNSDRFYVNEIFTPPPSLTYDVSINASPASNGITAGSSYTYNITVNNTGDTGGDYTLTVSDSDTTNFVPSVPGITSIYVPAGGSNTTTLQVTANSTAAGEALDTTTITATSVQDSSYTNSTQVQTTVISKYNITIRAIPTSAAVNQGGNYTYDITVNNTGNANGDYTLTVSDSDIANFTPSVLGITSIYVPAGGSNTTTLTVTANSTAAGGALDTTTVTATSAQDSSYINSTQVQTTVTAKYNVTITALPTSSAVNQGGNHTYDVTVYNTGNADGDYILTVSDSDLANFVTPSVLGTTSIYVPAGGSNTTTLTVTANSTAAGGALDTITVTATSIQDSSYTDSAQVQTTVNAPPQPTYNVTISAVPISAAVTQGDNHTYDVTVYNTGNTNGDYTLTVSDSDLANFVTPSVLGTTSIYVPAGGSNTTTLQVTANSTAAGGALDTTTVTATSAQDPSYTNSTQVQTTVTATHDITITALPTSAAVTQGGNHTYDVTVYNTGNTNGYYTLTVSDSNTTNFASSVLGITSIYVPAGGSNTTTLKVTANNTAAGGALDTTTVTATSVQDSSYTNSTQVQTTVISKYNITINAVPTLSAVNQGGNHTYDVTVYNTGNADGDYILTVSDSDSTNFIAPSVLGITSIYVPAGGSNTTTLKVTANSTAAGGALDTITVTATSVQDSSYTNSTQVQTTVISKYNITIRAIPISAAVNQGGNYTYDITVNNTGNANGDYTLTVSDSDPANFTSSVLGITSIYVPAGGSNTTTLKVTANNTAAGGALDMTTVTATSVQDSSYINSTQVQTTVNVPPQPTYNVTITTLPTSAAIAQGGNHTYDVTVYNTGNTDGDYDLSLSDSDTTNFTSSVLGTTSIYIPAGGSNTTALQVTANSTAAGGALDTTTVTATSVHDSSYSDSAQVQTTIAGEQGGGPDCKACHDAGGSAPQLVNFSAANNSGHKNLNSEATSTVNAENKKCWACHGDGTQPGSGHPSAYKTPAPCENCHIGTGGYSAPLVKEHNQNGTDVQTTAACILCHDNNGMIIESGGIGTVTHYVKDVTDTSTTPYGHSGTINTTNCIICHRGQYTNDSAWGSPMNISTSSKRQHTETTNAQCDTCHRDTSVPTLANVDFHNSALTDVISANCLDCHAGAE